MYVYKWSSLVKKMNKRTIKLNDLKPNYFSFGSPNRTFGFRSLLYLTLHTYSFHFIFQQNEFSNKNCMNKCPNMCGDNYCWNEKSCQTGMLRQKKPKIQGKSSANVTLKCHRRKQIQPLRRLTE